MQFVQHVFRILAGFIFSMVFVKVWSALRMRATLQVVLALARSDRAPVAAAASLLMSR